MVGRPKLLIPKRHDAYQMRKRQNISTDTQRKGKDCAWQRDVCEQRWDVEELCLMLHPLKLCKIEEKIYPNSKCPNLIPLEFTQLHIHSMNCIFIHGTCQQYANFQSSVLQAHTRVNISIPKLSGRCSILTAEITFSSSLLLFKCILCRKKLV